jgi:hypothetical protein
MDVRQRLAVHREHDEVVGIHRLLDRHAARDRVLARVGEALVDAVMAGELRALFHARGLQHVGHPHAGPFGAARAAVGPLVAARLRREERAAVAAALQHHAARHRLELLFQLAERDLDLVVDLAVNRHLPRVGILAFLGDRAVVADEESFGRRRVVVEHVLRRLRDQRTIAEQHQLVALARIFQVLRPLRRGGRRRRALRHRSGDHAARHVGGKRYRPTDGGTHRRQPCSAEEAAPVEAGFAAESFGIRAFRVVRVQFFDGAFFFHCRPPLSDRPETRLGGHFLIFNVLNELHPEHPPRGTPQAEPRSLVVRCESGL